jgi:polysaccharide biosynthesis transport protein
MRTRLSSKGREQEKEAVVSLDSLEQKSFQHYWQIGQRRWLPASIVFATALALGGFAVSMQKPSYTAAGKLMLQSNRLPSLTGLGGETAGKVSNLTVQSNPLKTEAETITSAPLLEKTIAALNLRDNDGKPASPYAMAKAIKVKDVAGADVLRITYDDKNPKKAADIVNQLMKVYAEHNVLVNRSEAAAARDFISEQLPKSQSTVRAADAALRQFKEANNLADLDSEQKLTTSAVLDLENQITKARTDLSEASTRTVALQMRLGMDPEQALAASTLSQSPGVQKALGQLQEVQSQLEVERSRYEDKHPTVANLQRKETALQESLQSRIEETIGQSQVSTQDLSIGEVKQGIIREYVGAEVARLSLASRLVSLESARQSYRQRVGVLPRLEQEQRELQRQLEAAQYTYEALLKKLQEVELAEKQNIGTARILEFAETPNTPSNTSKQLGFVLVALMAAVAALMVAIVLELRDRSLKTIQDARDLFGYAWLGSIPQVGKLSTKKLLAAKRQDIGVPELPVRDDPRSPVSVAYRMLQANLKFLNFDDQLKSIVITSSVPKEGKSTIAANLAATMAQLGRRTLLIDADLHHPVQHHIWGLTNAQGLSNVIAAQAELQRALEHVMPNLDILTAGIIPPDPLVLLDSRRMAALLGNASQHYDCVVIDAPPLIVQAEALTLGKLSDGILLVVRPGIVDVESAKTAKELLEQSCQTVAGMVVNGSASETDFRRASYYDSTPRVADPRVAEATAVPIGKE